jgi:hypothetical protein
LSCEALSLARCCPGQAFISERGILIQKVLIHFDSLKAVFYLNIHLHAHHLKISVQIQPLHSLVALGRKSEGLFGVIDVILENIGRSMLHKTVGDFVYSHSDFPTKIFEQNLT